jgi:enterochelin esterase-like enzyme
MILLLASCASNPPACAQGDTNESHRSTLTSPTTQPYTNTNTTPTPKVCVENAGSIQDLTIPSSVLDDDIKVKLTCLPVTMKNPQKRYSVLYMLHGQNSQEDQWFA